MQRSLIICAHYHRQTWIDLRQTKTNKKPAVARIADRILPHSRLYCEIASLAVFENRDTGLKKRIGVTSLTFHGLVTSLVL